MTGAALIADRLTSGGPACGACVCLSVGGLLGGQDAAGRGQGHERRGQGATDYTPLTNHKPNKPASDEPYVRATLGGG